MINPLHCLSLAPCFSQQWVTSGINPTSNRCSRVLLCLFTGSVDIWNVASCRCFDHVVCGIMDDITNNIISERVSTAKNTSVCSSIERISDGTDRDGNSEAAALAPPRLQQPSQTSTSCMLNTHAALCVGRQ
jgi:hypothetical protein